MDAARRVDRRDRSAQVPPVSPASDRPSGCELFRRRPGKVVLTRIAPVQSTTDWQKLMIQSTCLTSKAIRKRTEPRVRLVQGRPRVCFCRAQAHQHSHTLSLRLPLTEAQQIKARLDLYHSKQVRDAQEMRYDREDSRRYVRSGRRCPTRTRARSQCATRASNAPTEAAS